MDLGKEQLEQQIEQFKEKISEILSNERSRTYLIMGVTAVLAAIYLSFAIIPKSTELASVSRKVRDLNENIDLVAGRVKRLDSINKKLNDLRLEQAGYSEKLPVQKEIPALLEDLASMARTSKVDILSIAPSKLRSTDKGGEMNKYFLEMPVSITARSGYHELGYFISNLEQGERLIVIKDLTIKDDPRDPWMHTVRIMLNAYVSVE